MGYRSNCYGRGQALHGDKTTTGAVCLTSLPNATEHGLGVIRIGDATTDCPKCGRRGKITSGEPHSTYDGLASAVDGSDVLCGCPPGTNRVIAPAGQWMGRGKSPARFQWVKDKYGRLIPVAYHTGADSGLDQVRVRAMRRNIFTGNYEFWADGAEKPAIIWTPDELEFKAPGNTGNRDEPYLPSTITVLPLPGRKKWAAPQPRCRSRMNNHLMITSWSICRTACRRFIFI
ncbi:S-type pyocin domain-containing protein [Rahnella aceris]|uniref:S-type pyocin domain-containing protein n=1 Tax=Rahnella sp. (strain Y9602) TaxID=2703885 RepID=UPI0020B73699|nr:S-type pyocin domain-containing protein [Rahnella aceris]